MSYPDGRFRPYGAVDLYDDDLTLLATDLSVTTGSYWTDELNEAGPAEVTVPDAAGAAASGLITEGRYLRFRVTGDNGDTWTADRTAVIERPKAVVVDAKPSNRQITAIGRDWLREWDDAIVDPPMACVQSNPANGINFKPVGRLVRFDWTHPLLDRSSWTNVYSLAPMFSADEDPLGNPWSLTWFDTVGRLGWSPEGWPDSFTGWIWSAPLIGDPPYRPAGERSYFYLPLTLDAGAFLPVFTCDNTGQLALDGAVIDEGAKPPAMQWERCTASGIDAVSAGVHHICATVMNDPGSGVNPAGLAFVGFQAVVDSYMRYDNVVARTGGVPGEVDSSDDPIIGGGWTCLHAPEDPPGFTPGQAFRILYETQAAQGCLPGWTLGFTDLLDSAGNAWTVTDQLTARVSDDTLLDVLKAWAAAGYVEFAARADEKVLDMWVPSGRGNWGTAAPGVLWDGDAVKSAIVEGRR